MKSEAKVTVGLNNLARFEFFFIGSSSSKNSAKLSIKRLLKLIYSMLSYGATAK